MRPYNFVAVFQSLRAGAGQKFDRHVDSFLHRIWLFVLDHCKGIDLVYNNGNKGETYNIGGRNERTNLQIVDRICQILDEVHPIKNNQLIQNSKLNIQNYKDLVVFVEDRAGHDRRYAIDATKLEEELGWKADENFDTGIVKTIEWYLKKYSK
jgi:dTDP-glucose 4,6-dehydratase